MVLPIPATFSVKLASGQSNTVQHLQHIASTWARCQHLGTCSTEQLLPQERRQVLYSLTTTLQARVNGRRVVCPVSSPALPTYLSQHQSVDLYRPVSHSLLTESC